MDHTNNEERVEGAIFDQKLVHIFLGGAGCK